MLYGKSLRQAADEIVPKLGAGFFGQSRGLDGLSKGDCSFSGLCHYQG
jgi:hypothetical protein